MMGSWVGFYCHAVVPGGTFFFTIKR